MRLTLVPLALAAILAGCATLTPAERAAQHQREMEQLMQLYGPACDKLGYQRDTDKWRDCVLNLAAQENYRRYQYRSYPSFSHCYGHPGFYHCTMF